MNYEHWYYLHTNGDLIHKRSEPEIERGGFVRRVWPFDPNNRVHAWIVCIESLAMGATVARVNELIALWELTDDDAVYFAAEFASQGKPLTKFFRDGTRWCAVFADFVDLQSSSAGFGDRVIDAYADLLRNTNAPAALEGRRMVWPAAA